MATALTALIRKELGLEAGSRSRQTPRGCCLRVNNEQMTGQPLQCSQFGRNAETPKGVAALRCGDDPVACLGRSWRADTQRTAMNGLRVGRRAWSPPLLHEEQQHQHESASDQQNINPGHLTCSFFDQRQLSIGRWGRNCVTTL